MMLNRKFSLAAVLLFIHCSYCQERVFIDIDQLVAEHPAWQIAERMTKEQKHPKPKHIAVTVHLADVQSSFKVTLVEEIRSWAERQLKAWNEEIEALKQKHLKIAGWKLHLALPPLPVFDPYARWRFIIQQKEKQIAERVRLNLRLAFSDLLSPEEKSALEQRLRELDAALEPPPEPQMPMTSSKITLEQIDLAEHKPLTDLSKIFALVAQPSPTPQQIFSVELAAFEFMPPTKICEDRLQTLRLMAKDFARSFVLAYAKKRGWQVTFKPEPNLPDVTEEVLKEWLIWLKRLSPKE